MSDEYPCPKCGSKHTWFEQEGDDLIQRCLCGLTRYMFQRLENGTTVLRSEPQVPAVTLPAENTKIHKCLMAVATSHPKNIMTGDIASRTGLKGKETASLVVTLMGRGLLERVSARRGLLGGSIWQLTEVAIDLLDIDTKGVDDYGIGTGYAGGAQLFPERHGSNGGAHSFSDESSFDDRWPDYQEGDDWP